MMTDKQIESIVELLSKLDSSKTKIYMGCDSVRYRDNGKWFAKFATVCVIHMNGNKGCKVFTARSVEQDYDIKKE